jgi:hypothetical protein
MISWLFFAIIAFMLYKAGKFIGNGFKRFLSVSDSRRTVWEWTKRLFYTVTALLLLVATFQRWYYFHDEMVYAGNPKQLDPAYASQVEVEAYLMSLQNVIDLFEGKPPNPDKATIPVDSPLYKKYPHNPSEPRFYLVIRVKNKGPKALWGVLDYFVEGKKMREIDVPPLPSDMKDFKNIVLQADFIWKHIPPKIGTFGPYPDLETKWQKLYTVQGEKP